MKIGLIDVDAVSRGKVTFPNLSLMKISAWHKRQGDHVEWYIPGLSDHMNLVYMAKVFGNEYSKDYPFEIDADWVIRGGSGYAISIDRERERRITNLSIIPSLTKLNISCPITAFTISPILLMVFSLVVVREVVNFVT